jgi:hypothetical protein
VKGQDKDFDATVTVTGGAAQTVTWTIVETGKSGQTTITDSGLLTVANDEPLTTLTVKATATADSTKSGTATVRVFATTGDLPTVTGITVTPAAPTVQRGGTQSFTAEVTGTNGVPDQDVTWSIVESVAAGTTINGSGVLTVAADQTPGTITVRATAVDREETTGNESTVYGDASVTVPATTVSNVTVTPIGSQIIHRGGTKTFTVVVTGEGHPSQDVTWSIVSGATGATAINSSGLLTVAEDQTMGSNVLTIRATAVDGGGTAYGETTVTVTVPAPVVTVTGTTSSSVTLSWAAVSDTQGYRVRRGTSSSTIDGSPIATPGPGETSYTDTGLSPNTTYWYEVEAYYGSAGSGLGPVKATTTGGSGGGGKRITLNNFPNNATMGIYLSTSNTGKASFQANIVAGAYDDIAYGNKIFHSIKQADSNGLSAVDWTGTGSYYVFIDGSGHGQYFYVSKNPISFASDNTIIDFVASEWTHLAAGEDWTPTGPVAATLTVSGLSEAIGLYCQVALFDNAGSYPDDLFTPTPPNMSLRVEITAATMNQIPIYDYPGSPGVWTATPNGTYMAVFTIGTASSAYAIYYGPVTLTGTHGAFNPTTFPYIMIPNMPGSVDIGNLPPTSYFGFTPTDSFSDTVTDGDGTHAYRHYTLNGTFADALATIEAAFGTGGYDFGYWNRYDSTIITSDCLLLELIDHPPAGIGGADEVRLIERSGGSVVNSRGWNQ